VRHTTTAAAALADGAPPRSAQRLHILIIARTAHSEALILRGTGYAVASAFNQTGVRIEGLGLLDGQVPPTTHHTWWEGEAPLSIAHNHPRQSTYMCMPMVVLFLPIAPGFSFYRASSLIHLALNHRTMAF
jgi:hypothetical protein